MASPQETNRPKYPLFSDFPEFKEDRQLSLEESRLLKELAKIQEGLALALQTKVDWLQPENDQLKEDKKKLQAEVMELLPTEMVTIYKYVEPPHTDNSQVATNQLDNSSNGPTSLPTLSSLESSNHGEVEKCPVETRGVAVGTEEDFTLPTPPETRSVGVNTDVDLPFATSRPPVETVSVGVGTDDDFTLMTPVAPEESGDVACETYSEFYIRTRPETNVDVSTDENGILPKSDSSTLPDTRQVAVNSDETERNDNDEFKRESPEMQNVINMKTGKRGSGHGGIKRKSSSDGNRESGGSSSKMRKRMPRALSRLLIDDPFNLAASIWDMKDVKRTTRSRSSRSIGNPRRDPRSA